MPLRFTEQDLLQPTPVNPLQPPSDLLQAIATELAFVEVSSASSLEQIAQAVAQLARSAGPGASTELAAELGWFESAPRAEWAASEALPAQAAQQLHQWYERLEAAWRSFEAEAASARAPEPVLVLKVAEDAELLHEFCSEGRELLQHIEDGVLVLEEQPQHMDTLNQVFRAFHTFKGGAGFLSLEPIKNLAHELESLLDSARRGSLRIDRRMIELILAGGDTLRRFVNQISEHLAAGAGAPLTPIATTELIARVQACLRGEPDPHPAAVPGDPGHGGSHTIPQPAMALAAETMAPAQPEPPLNREASAAMAASLEGTPVSPPPAALVPDAAGGAGNAPHGLQAMQDRQDASDAATPAGLQSAGPTETAPTRAAKPSQPPRASASDPLPNYVRLDTEKIDALVDLVGELLIAQSMVVQHPEVMRLEDRELSRHLRQLARITSDLQHNAMSLRMVPVRGAFQKMNRLVPALSPSLGKQVQLQLVGEEIELDRNIVEQLSDPLVHMVRNCLDHGIESPQERTASGKPAQGTVRLEAMHQGGGIVIRISDDGRGMDPARILAKAMERGLVGPDFSGNDKDIFDLIFAPGFSTAEQVTDISGRGVGMDVVRSSISRLRGRTEVQSAPGQGSSFTIFLPLTLAIIDGMLVRVGSARFIIPTLSIRESFRPRPGQVSTVQGQGELVSVRGRLIPLLRLARQLGLEGALEDPTQGLLVVTQAGAHVYAFLVDELIGKKEVVIKSLGEAFRHLSGLSGAAILGDGQPTLILDPDALGRGLGPSVSLHSGT